MPGSTADEDYAFGLYPDGSGVLRNKLGLRDAKTLEIVEYQTAEDRSRDAPVFPPTQTGFQALHRHLLGDVFEWAGELRTVDMSKAGSRFATARFLDATLQTIFTELARQNHLRDRTGERFADGAAHHISELNVAHPFREGNGRAMRLHLQQLAEQAGHSINQGRISKEAWIAASIRGYEGDERALAGVIAGALRPARLITPAAAIAELRDAMDPARLAIQDATRTVRDRLGGSRVVAEVIQGYRAELGRLATVDTLAERLTDLDTPPGLLQVHAPLSSTPRDRAHAIIAAADRLPASLVMFPKSAGAVATSRVETQDAYLARTTSIAGQPATQAPAAPSASNASPPQRPVRRPRDPEPGF